MCRTETVVTESISRVLDVEQCILAHCSIQFIYPISLPLFISIPCTVILSCFPSKSSLKHLKTELILRSHLGPLSSTISSSGNTWEAICACKRSVCFRFMWYSKRQCNKLRPSLHQNVMKDATWKHPLPDSPDWVSSSWTQKVDGVLWLQAAGVFAAA